MSFFKKLVKSIYSPKFYQEVIQQPAGKAVGYYFGLITLIAMVLAVIGTVFAAPALKSFVNEFGIEVNKMYPDDLRLTIQNGKVSINQPEPYMIRLPQSFIDSQRQDGSVAPIENIVVVDTLLPFSYERFSAYNTFAWITRDGIGVVDQDVRARYVEFDSSTSQVIDKPFVSGLVQAASGIIGKFVYAIFPLIFILVFLIGVFVLPLYALVAVLVMVMANKVINLELSYPKAWAVTLHLATAGILWTIIDALIPWFQIPLGSTIVIVILAYLNLKGTAPAVASQPPVNQGSAPLPPQA